MMDMRPQRGTSAKEKGAADLKWKKIADKPGELLSAGIVAGALLLSLGLSWLGYVDGQTRVQAREAAALGAAISYERRDRTCPSLPA